MQHQLVNNSTSGLEYISRSAFFVAFNHLNSYMDQVNESWEAADEEFAQITGRDHQPVVLEHIKPENFHVGFRPSLINAPMENYPNCAVMVPRSSKAPGSDDLDHQSISSMTLIVELMAYTDTDQDISVVNSKAQRMAEAFEAMMQDHKTLGGIITSVDDSPTIVLGGVFTRKAKQGRGKDWYWQGARLEYGIRKDSIMPSAGHNRFLNPTTASAYGTFDQQ